MRLLLIMLAAHNRSELQDFMSLKHRDSFVARYLQPALTACLVEMTIPD
jgi:hypothetical protein